jgi:hypothetical protein
VPWAVHRRVAAPGRTLPEILPRGGLLRSPGCALSTTSPVEGAARDAQESVNLVLLVWRDQAPGWQRQSGKARCNSAGPGSAHGQPRGNPIQGPSVWSSSGCRWPKSHTVTGHGNPAGPPGTGGAGNKKGELTPPGSKNVVPVGSCDPTGASSRIGARHALVPAGIGRPFGCRLPDAVPLLGGVVRPHGDGRFGTLRFANDGGWTSEPPDSWTGLATDRTGDPEPALHDRRAGTGSDGTGTVMITCVPHPHGSHPPSQGCLWIRGRRWQPAPPPLHIQPVQGLML